MIMDDSLTDALKAIFKLIGGSFRAIAWLFWEIFFETITWYIGWFVCRTLSLGHYPDEPLGGEDDADISTTIIVGLTGLITLSVLLALIYKLFAG